MNEAMLTFSTGVMIILAVLYFLHLQIDCNNRIVLDRFRFKYFALRDRLAMLVIEGKLDEDSWEYKTLIDSINFHIATVEQRSISEIIKQLVTYHLSQEERRRVKIIKRKTDHAEVIAILSDLFKTTYRLLERNSKIQFFLIRRAARKETEVQPFKELASIKSAADNLNEYQEELSLAAGQNILRPA